MEENKPVKLTRVQKRQLKWLGVKFLAKGLFIGTQAGLLMMLLLISLFVIIDKAFQGDGLLKVIAAATVIITVMRNMNALNADNKASFLEKFKKITEQK